MANSNFQRPTARHYDDRGDYDDRREIDPREQQVESDPLAELARLIGQTDPLSSFGREAQQQREAHEQEPQQYQDEQHYHEPREPHFAQDPFARDPYDARHRMAGHQHDLDEEAPPPPSWLRGATWQDDPRAPADDRFYAGTHEAHAPETQPDMRYAAGADDRYDDALYGRVPGHDHGYDEGRPDDGPPYAYPGHEWGYDEQYAAGEEEAPSRRRGGLLTVGIVAALAVVGTAGAFAYRSFSGDGKPAEPAVIHADATPTKIVPPAQSKDPSGKIITDRIGPSGERIVSREETPIDVKGSAAAPRVVFPPLTQQSAAAAPMATAAQQGGAIVGGISDEPKRIKTVSIRPDQAEQPTSRAPASAPAASAGSAAPRAAAPANGDGPIQLAPQRSTTPERVASIPPQATAPAPQPTVGGYVVQISSQRSEADAQASFRALQSKFPNVLASRSPLIKRADLGERGIYYRAMVGPFASSEQATQVCSDLKSAGGQCVVQRN